MATGNRCYLCGGKLRRGRCESCGLDNARMTRRNYRLNVTTPYHVKQQQIAASRAEDLKYAKEYKKEQASSENYGKPVSQQVKVPVQKPHNAPLKDNKKEVENKYKKQWIGTIVGILFLLFPLLTHLGSCVGDTFDDFTYGTPEFVYTEEEPLYIEDMIEDGALSEEQYAWVSRELSAEGDYYKDTLSQGCYVVGVHIPEGNYSIEVVDGSYLYSYLKDDENGIYISLNLGTDARDSLVSVDNLKLYEGAILEVTGDGSILFESENAQVDDVHGMENPISPEYVATFTAEADETCEVLVGEDIPEGVYDLRAVSGWDNVRISYPADDEERDEYFYEYSYWLDSEVRQDSYKNIVLTDGTIVSFVGCEIQFVPSEWIVHDQYQDLFVETNIYF